jgi:peroxiredoxin
MILLALIFVALCNAAEPAKTGPAVGSRIPEFSAVDQDGRRQTCESLRGPKGLVLLFSRSADWCPFCKAQLQDLNQRLEDYRSRGLGVASVTSDSVAILKNYATRKEIKFPMLADSDAKVVRAFGILNETVAKDTPFYGVPYPGTYIINERGLVKSKYFQADSRESYTSASILTHEFGVDGKEKTTVETPHLKLSYSASDAVLTPGRRASLLVDIELKPKMHVYAPGIEGSYKPVEWVMPESKSWSVVPVVFPPSRKLRLEAIDETVPVYEGKARFVRDLLVGPVSVVKQGELTVDGTFRYQACDDRMCYNPRSIPLRWTFRIAQLDSERVPEELQRKAQ